MTSIKTKFLLPILAVQIVALAALGLLGYKFSSDILRNSAENSFEETIDSIYDEITSTLSERIAKIKALAEDPTFLKFAAAPFYKPDADALVLNFQRGNGLVLGEPSLGEPVNFPVGLLADEGNKSISATGIFPSVEYIGTDGRVRLHVYLGGSNDADFEDESSPKLNHIKENYFQEALAGKTFIGRPLPAKLYLREYDPIGISTKEVELESNLVRIAIPQFIGDKIAGIIVATTTRDFIFKQLPEGDSFTLLEITDSSGALIAKAGNEGLEKELHPAKQEMEDHKSSVSGGMIESLGKYIELSKVVPPTDWKISMFARKSDVYRQVDRLRNITLAVILASLGIMGAVIFVIISRLTNPILRLTSASNRIAKGELGLVIEKTSDDEIGVLTDSFNKMSVSTKEINETLEMQNARLSRVNYVRRQLLHIISHELRTPLNGITGFYELLGEEVLDGIVKDTKEFAECMEGLGKSIRRYQSLVERLTKASSVMSREMNMEDDEKDAHCQIAETIEISVADARKFSGNPIVFNCGEGDRKAQAAIPSDALKLVIDEALSNAIKFSPDNANVEISLAFNTSRAEIFIRDHGKGIPREFIDDVIEPFFEVADASTHFTDRFKKGGGGLGLGLTVIASVLKRYSGTMKILSQPDKGTTLIISLPTVG